MRCARLSRERQFLAATVARPQDLKYGCVERFDDFVDQRRVPRQKLLLLFDYREMAVKITGFPESPARLVAHRDIVKQRPFLCLVAVNFQAEHSEARIVQRRRTTSSAASFSETKSTVLPLASAAAIRFVMVCDFPVPGGPSMTRFWPRSA